MASDDARQLLEHLEWADAAVWRQVLATPAASGDARTRELLIHSHTVQWLYLQICRGEAPLVREAETFPDLVSVASWARQYHRERAQFAATLSDVMLAEQVRFPWENRLAERFGAVQPATIAQAITQVAMHSAHHRGQVNTRLKELGGEPPLVDFIAWVWTGRPASQWPET
jgi:uncharacterized damage-inducible protein DinB